MIASTSETVRRIGGEQRHDPLEQPVTAQTATPPTPPPFTEPSPAWADAPASRLAVASPTPGGSSAIGAPAHKNQSGGYFYDGRLYRIRPSEPCDDRASSFEAPARPMLSFSTRWGETVPHETLTRSHRVCVSTVSEAMTWYISLDDGSGAERNLRVIETPIVGELLDAHGRAWQVFAVHPDRKTARAVPVDTLSETD